MQWRHISVIKEVTCVVDEGMAVDVVYLGFSKAFYTVPHSIHQDTLSSCGMSRFVMHGAEWKGRAQRVVGMRLHLPSDQSLVMFLMVQF